MAKDSDDKGGDNVIRADIATRFTSKTAPRTGRKPGTKNKAPIERAVEDRLDEMLDAATRNIEAALAAGDAKTSMWFIEHMRRQRGTRVEKGLLAKLGAALDRIEDIELVSRRAVLLAIDGDMTFEELTAIQAALGRHSSLAGLIELKGLREELAELRDEVSGNKTENGMQHAPAWGRLIERTSQPEDAELDDDDDDDAEDVPNGKSRAL